MTVKLPLILISCKLCSVHSTTYSQVTFFINKALVQEDYFGINGKKKNAHFYIYLPDYAPSH